MLFAHDTDCSLTAAAALVNTDGRDGEGLPDVAALDEFFTAHSYTGRHEHTETELAAVRRLRPRLRRVWHADTDEIVAIVNGLLREHRALPQLIAHDDEPYHFHAVPRDAPLATRIAVEAAMALADLVRMGELSRLRVCEHPDCDDVLVDLSKNRSRRFCDANCGNRAAVSAYRARKAAARG
ncbi:CGNR zinc finger domain-containing protein [Micromonospora endolithica]|uniref:CGNR zinc finger domain-containing protein n=1 Tax=Micromonospora endolithica TaxID=230091 RepID=A0A3A9YSC2_9ACTN|nr:CGNR zinc finger domain-containing protein [Micromonospora endolithica]RKN38875.1 CGNR zinc finger domain-containing protein [Micromonospora endolithica]TWJ25500.1 putative stress-induced transcription regulator [Micromonospora endolithica]